MDSSESLLSSSGLGSVSVLGLSFLSLDYALKNEKISLSCYFVFLAYQNKIKNCCSSVTAFAFCYAFSLVFI
jgi:hypothetical protein